MRAAVLAVALAGCGGAWEWHDTLGQVLVDAALAVDSNQAVHAVQVGGYTEGNPIMGPHPTVGVTVLYGLSVAVVHAAVAVALPPRWRTAWNAAWLVSQAHTIAHNYSEGLGFGF